MTTPVTAMPPAMAAGSAAPVPEPPPPSFRRRRAAGRGRARGQGRNRVSPDVHQGRILAILPDGPGSIPEPRSRR